MTNAISLSESWGYLYKEEVEAIRSLALTLPIDSICINIGAGVGTSGMIFMECPNVGALYTVDITCGDSPLGGLGNERITFEQAGLLGNPRHHQICGDSTEVGKIWNSGLVDMVFVDGDHTYEHCKSDIEAWLPHIKQGGIMSLHDYEAHYWPGVKKATDEVLERYEMIKQTRTVIAFRIQES
jgi:predicted O-methyltransferase YrrM